MKTANQIPSHPRSTFRRGTSATKILAPRVEQPNGLKNKCYCWVKTGVGTPRVGLLMFRHWSLWLQPWLRVWTIQVAVGHLGLGAGGYIKVHNASQCGSLCSPGHQRRFSNSPIITHHYVGTQPIINQLAPGKTNCVDKLSHPWL